MVFQVTLCGCARRATRDRTCRARSVMKGASKMRHRWIPLGVVACVLSALGLVAVLSPSVRAEEGDAKAEAPLPQCPVMDESVDPSLKLATDDGPVYFCCARCVEKFNEHPDRFAERVAKQREALKDLPKVQVICPVSHEPIDS